MLGATATATATASRLDALIMVRTVHSGQPGTLRVLTVGDPDAALAAVVETAASYHLTGVTVEPVSLQTVFLTLTGRGLRD